VVAQWLWWEMGGNEHAEVYIFFYEKGNENHQVGAEFFFTSENSIRS